MVDRIWLKSYPPGVPYDIDAGRYASLADIICEGLRLHAGAFEARFDLAGTQRRVDVLEDDRNAFEMLREVCRGWSDLAVLMLIGFDGHDLLVLRFDEFAA